MFKKNIFFWVMLLVCFGLSVSVYATNNTESTNESLNNTDFTTETENIPTTIASVYDPDIDTGNHHYEEDIPEDCTCNMCKVIKNMYQINETNQTKIEDKVSQAIPQKTHPSSNKNGDSTNSLSEYTNTESSVTDVEKTTEKIKIPSTIVSESNSERKKISVEVSADNGNSYCDWRIWGAAIVALSIGSIITAFVIKKKKSLKER